MDDGVGGQFGGEEDGFIHHGHWAQREPDELTNSSDLIGGRDCFGPQ
jgi:hypothetical protein